MANTDLFHRLRRAMRLAHASNHAGFGAAEALQRWEHAAPDRGRRAFLRSATLAAAGAAAGCAGLRDASVPTAPSSGAEVAVIGAGLAGLTVAWRLRQAGVPVSLYEAQTRLGGRVLSLRDHFADRQVAELGAELIDTGHRHMRELAVELSLELDDFNDYRPELARALYWFEGRRRSEAEVVEAFRPIAALIDADLGRLGSGDISWREPQNAQDLDRLSIDDWFDRHGVSGWIRTLLSVAYTTEMGLETSEQSSLNLLTFISTQADPFHVFGDSDERFHTRGGNDRFVSELARRLEGAIQTGAVLEAVAQSDNGRYRLSLRRDGASTDVHASHVVLALPVSLLREVKLDVELPEIKRLAIAELAYGSNAKLMIGFARRTWTQGAGCDGSTFSDLRYQSCWETSRQQVGEAGILTNFTGGRHGLEVGQGSAAEQARRAVTDLEQVFPGIAAQRQDMTEARFHWPSNPWVRGSYVCPKPGQWTRLGGAIGEAVGRLRFAGEHCSGDNQGFMEGAVESGETTARELLQELGVVNTGASRRRMLGLG
ncbi:flavin monoamine oxidase family protein [Panacagrimonas sp.]|uniref:flavin monoamine oxidase family protein n=1 Tax=Panacagrimonas sp. TaxID=2480088 RepID=UPI003B524997